MILAVKARYNAESEVTVRRFIFEYKERYYQITANILTEGYNAPSETLFNIKAQMFSHIDCELPLPEKRRLALNYTRHLKGRHLEYQVEFKGNKIIGKFFPKKEHRKYKKKREESEKKLPTEKELRELYTSYIPILNETCE